METGSNASASAEERTKNIQEKTVDLSDPNSIKQKYGEIYEISVVVDGDDEN